MAVAENSPSTPRGSAAGWADFVHTGPGTLAGRYLRSFWQPVFAAASLPAGRAVPIRIMSEDFTLYRGEDGTAHVIAPRCAHRGTQLSTGWVEGDCVRCFYHGWKYDGTGQCVEMPAEDASFPPKVKIESYPTEEYLGLIFAWLGEGEAPPLPRYPEFEGEGVLESYGYTRLCNYFNNIDNNVDPVHTLITHQNSGFKFSGLRGVPRIAAEESDWGITQFIYRADGDVRLTQFGMPTMLLLTYYPGDPAVGWRDLVTWRVPIDDGQHWLFNVELTHLTGEAATRYRERQAAVRARVAALPAANEVAAAVLRGELHIDEVQDRPDLIAIQDHVAQCGQGVIADRSQERLGRSDSIVILMRQIWARELRALAEGRPLKQWARTEKIVTTTGVRSAS